MAFPKKHERSRTRGLRISCVTDDFLKDLSKQDENFTANDFINNLIQNSDEFKKYLARKNAYDNTPSLDLYSQETETYEQIKANMNIAISYLVKGDFSKFTKFGTGWHK